MLILYKVILTWKSVNDTLLWNDSKEFYTCLLYECQPFHSGKCYHNCWNFSTSHVIYCHPYHSLFKTLCHLSEFDPHRAPWNKSFWTVFPSSTVHYAFQIKAFCFVWCHLLTPLLVFYFWPGIPTNWSWATAKEGRGRETGRGTEKCCEETSVTTWRITKRETSWGQKKNGNQE